MLRRLALLCTLLIASLPVRADTTEIRAAVLKIGTVNWELDTITHYGLDTANGVTLSVTGYASSSAARVAFQGGEADLIVADWIWVARQRADGKDFVFIPYSTSVGGLLVSKDDSAKSLSDLRGSKIGIAGGPVDKSWLLLRAYAQKEFGFDLAAETEQVFGAPPLIFKAGLSGEVAGAINFWHFGAKMQAAGMQELVSTATAATALGLDPGTPLLGYVVKGEFIRDNPDAVAGFVAASRAAKDRLASDETAWDRLRPMMNAKSDAQLEALKSGWKAGIPEGVAVDEADAAALLKVMADYGGADLVGRATTLPEGVFYKVTQ